MRSLIGIAAITAAALLGATALAQPVTVAIPPRWLADVPPRDAPLPGEGVARETLGQVWAMVGREDRIATEAKPVCTVAEIDPIEGIARAAAQSQIVIINEAHDSPRDRAFIADVAVRLATLGFDTYAAEALTHPVAAREAGDDAPRLRDGGYTQEPMYGALLRAVRREGYTLVAYDDAAPTDPTADFVDSINRHEAAQTSNLINRIFLPNRDAKVLIHVGYAHNEEDVQRFPGNLLRPREVRWLARRLKDILGVDPLTIDQTTFAADRPGLCNAGAAGAALPPGRDLYVGHPALAFDRNRPTWRDDTGARVTEVPRRLKRADQRIIVEARAAEDAVDVVPVDRVLIDPGEDIPLLLPPGRYKVRAWLENGTATPDAAVTVRPAPKPPAVSRVSAEASK